MTRTQIQLPDDLFREAKRFADREEMSMAELVRHSLELFMHCTAPAAGKAREGKWTMPVARDMKTFGDPFEDPDWRVKLHMRGMMPDDLDRVAEPAFRAGRAASGASGARKGGAK